MREPYPTDLTDSEWAIVQAFFEPPHQFGRPRDHDMREIVNAIRYFLRAGCAWRLLPHDFPPWSTVHYYFRNWRRSGLWETINTALRERLRTQAGRAASPSAAIIDSQSAKTTEKGGSMAMTATRD